MFTRERSRLVHQAEMLTELESSGAKFAGMFYRGAQLLWEKSDVVN